MADNVAKEDLAGAMNAQNELTNHRLGELREWHNRPVLYSLYEADNFTDDRTKLVTLVNTVGTFQQIKFRGHTTSGILLQIFL